jgi:protein TonB
MLMKRSSTFGAIAVLSLAVLAGACGKKTPETAPAPAPVAAAPETRPAAPPPPPPPTAPVRVGGNIKTPTKTKDVRPVYPPIAQSARVQGVVILEATIGPDGRVQDVRVLRSIPLLDAAAIEAVRQWQYTPTLLNGVPVPVIMTVTVNFTLR